MNAVSGLKSTDLLAESFFVEAFVLGGLHEPPPGPACR